MPAYVQGGKKGEGEGKQILLLLLVCVTFDGGRGEWVDLVV